MNIINSIWFSGVRTIGIVLGIDEITNVRKAYIGMGNGISKENDEKIIANSGTKFTIEAAKSIVGFLEDNRIK